MNARLFNSLGIVVTILVTFCTAQAIDGAKGRENSQQALEVISAQIKKLETSIQDLQNKPHITSEEAAYLKQMHEINQVLKK
jgi:hypothetical protein